MSFRIQSVHLLNASLEAIETVLGEESVLIDQSFHYLTSSEKPSDNVGIAKV